jgi:hypothetical protein
MPTGYTSKLVSEGQSFPEFAMRCARNFGALIMMRDEPLDAPIPEQFEPCDYCEKRLAEARATKARLLAMTMQEANEFGATKKSERITELKDWLDKDTQENTRLSEMERQVVAWQPPTKNHQGLKEFMLEQIETSMNDTDYITDELMKAEETLSIEFYLKALDDAERDISYYEAEMVNERERTNSRNEWLRQLRDSL